MGGPTVGVLLNITPDHLDRHGSMETYAAIKERVVAGSRIAFVGVDDQPSMAIHERCMRGSGDRGRVYPVSSERRLRYGVFRDGSLIVFAHAADDEVTLCDIAGIGTLRGDHNAQNACFAAAIVDALQVMPERDAEAVRSEIQRGVDTFPGLPHRMENVGHLGRTLFINDSKATNADSAEKALLSFERVHWILGGKPKEGGIEPLRALFTKVDKAYLIGAATDEFVATLEGAVPYARCGTLEAAVAAAAADAAQSDLKEPVVLLSPACASYDQYPNFERRGDHFRDLVRALPGFAPRS